MKTILHSGHRIEIKGWCKEKIYYDGKEISAKWSVLGSTHIFRVKENGEQIQYEVAIGTHWHGISWWCEVRRKGELIYTDR